MSDYRSAMLQIDKGRGIAGLHLGPPCNVYRPGVTSAVNYLDAANLIASGVRVGRRMNVAKADVEAPQMGTIFYALMVNATGYLTGDVFVEADPYYGAGHTIVDFSTTQFEGYCLAYHAPFRRTIAARLDRTATIYRPVTTPTADSVGPYWSATLSATTMAPVVLTNGVWSVGAIGATPAQIPVGVQSQHRLRGDMFKGLPSATGETTWFFYVPALSGFVPQEGDRVVVDGTLASGNRYVVHHPYNQQAGFQGSQLVCTREIH